MPSSAIGKMKSPLHADEVRTCLPKGDILFMAQHKTISSSYSIAKAALVLMELFLLLIVHFRWQTS